MTHDDSATQPKLMTVRARNDGRWYVGNGRSMANGPHERPEQLISVVSDLMGTNTNWRIEVLGENDALIAAYDAREFQAASVRDRSRSDWPESVPQS